MQFYYFLDDRLEGPVSAAELAELLQAETLQPETPAWSPIERDWTPCATAAFLGDGTAELMEFDDSELSRNQAFAARLDRHDLPSPQALLTLRLARDRGSITESQHERLREELLEEAAGGATPGEEDVLARLSERGWVSHDETEEIVIALQADAVPDRIAGYRILEELGRGGMGITYRAVQVAMDRVVALKVLLPRFSQDEDYIERFKREARMAARLNHETIATAYEVGEDGGRYFLSMEYVEGRTLDDCLDERGRFAEEEAREIVLQVTQALAHACEHEVVHRDISPKNIIMKDDGRIKVIDMGLAKSARAGRGTPGDSTLTGEGVVIGTPAYMSPERACGEENIDVRSDIYSLGCVWYEMLTGEPPLVGETKFETINRHIHEALPSVRESCPEVGELTDMLIRRMARPRPEERFQTPQEVLEAFEADAGEARALLESAADLPPVREQIAEWRPGEPVEVRLRAREREYVHVISRKVEEMLEAEGVDPEFQGYAQTVFTELVANAFDHGCRDRPDGVVRIRLELNEAFFRVEVIDPGPGFAAREMLDRIKDEPLDRERRRGIFQVLGIADLLEYSPKGNHAKAVLYRKSEGSGVFSHTANDILYVEIKGKGDLALAETFRRWVENLHLAEPTRLCLMVRTDWVSSMFVGTIGKLQTAIQESGSALSVWAEHRSCYRIMQQLGVTSFVHIYDSLESAELALRYKSLARPGADGEESPAESAEDSPETPGAGEEPSARPSGPRSRRAADRRGSDRRRGAAPPESFWNRLRRLFGGK